MIIILDADKFKEAFIKAQQENEALFFKNTSSSTTAAEGQEQSAS